MLLNSKTSSITGSCGFDKTDCLSFDPSTNEPIPDYSFSAENGCLTDNDRKQLLKQCPKTCKRYGRWI